LGRGIIAAQLKNRIVSASHPDHDWQLVTLRSPGQGFNPCLVARALDEIELDSLNRRRFQAALLSALGDFSSYHTIAR
jgi:hypothetical protein